MFLFLFEVGNKQMKLLEDQSVGHRLELLNDLF